MSIKFRPGKLGKKPDALTRCWDVYNQADPPSRTTKRMLFTPEQLANALEETSSSLPKLQVVTIADPTKLLMDIQEALKSDPEYLRLTEPDGTLEDSHWELRNDGLLYFEDQIYVPESQDLRLRVVQLKHDHILAGHPG